MASQLITNLTEIAADQVGDSEGSLLRNPQLLREWQGRLRWRNLLLTFLLSLVAQGLVLLRRFSQLPSINNVYQSQQYCLKPLKEGCEVGPDKLPLLDWPVIWGDTFRDLSDVLVWMLILGGVYLLAADLSKETRRGTLKFLRMSPQSSRRILLGKLLGVPVLLYLGIGLMLPLHLATGLMATFPLKILLGFYGLLGAIAICFYAAAMWFALLTPGLQGFQTWLITGLSASLLSWYGYYGAMASDWFHLFNPIHLLAYWSVQGWSGNSTWPFSGSPDLDGFRQLVWFSWPAGLGGDEYLALALPNALILGLWFWRVLERKFQTPAQAPLGKLQSYGLTLCLSLLAMGFTVPSLRTNDNAWSFPLAMLICAVIMMFLLLPSHQAVLDWARYRHQRPQGQRSLLRDLLIHDSSPAPFAMGINLALMGGVALLGEAVSGNWFTVINDGNAPLHLRWLFCALFLFSCTLVMQWISLANLRHGRWIMFGTVMALVLGWPFTLGWLGSNAYGSSIWLMTVLPPIIINDTGLGAFGGAIAAHLCLISGLSFVLSRRLQHLGQSEWKALSASQSRSSLARS